MSFIIQSYDLYSPDKADMKVLKEQMAFVVQYSDVMLIWAPIR